MSFDDIYEKYFDRVYRFVNVRVMNHMDSEDITVKIFEKIYRSLDTYSPEKGSLDVWIFTIARNEVTSFFRTKKIQVVSMECISEINDSTSSPENIMETNIKNERLYNAIGNLNDNERFAVSCKYGAGLTNIEIAELMDISSSNVGVVLFRSMKKLKKELEG